MTSGAWTFVIITLLLFLGMVWGAGSQVSKANRGLFYIWASFITVFTLIAAWLLFSPFV